MVPRQSRRAEEARPVFQVAASRDNSDIRILNEPLNGSSVFLVETGEGRAPRLESINQAKRRIIGLQLLPVRQVW